MRSLVAPATYAGRPGGRVDQLPGTRRWLAASLEQLRPDVVHTHLVHASLLVASLRLAGAPPTVLTHHHGSAFASSRVPVYRWLDRWATRRFVHVVAVSEFVRRFLV